MHAEVLIKLDSREFRFELRAEDSMSQDMARKWLDDQVVALECEPIRASGKLLRVDKVLVVARDAGISRFDDFDWGTKFAAATVALLNNTVVRVDADAMTVTF